MDAKTSAAGAHNTRRAAPLGNLGRLRRMLAPAAQRPFAILESAAFTFAVLAFAWALDHRDPLLLHGNFPWLWLVPTVIALRYGVLVGVGSGLLLAAEWQVLYPAGAAWPSAYFAGGLIQVIVTGHFGDTWAARTTRAASINDYLNDRLAALTNNHYLLRLSHERLEKDLLTRPTTLRDSITELRRLSLAPDSAERTPLPGAARLLEYVARACQVEVAALYPVRGGKLGRQALATVGAAPDLVASDPLVRLALDTAKLAHLKSEHASAHESRYLVCAPLLSADDTLLALLVIEKMPFLSLNYDNLQMMLVLLGYYGDGVEHSRVVRAVLDAVPGCPLEFALEYARLARLQRTSGIDSSVVALSFRRDEEHDSLFEHVLRRGRSLDLAWPLQTERRSVLINLMPLTDSAGIEGYLARIESNLQSQFDTDFDRAGIGVHTLHVNAVSTGANLAGLVQRADAHA
ncbi:PelD GGDEF domain-containing protein [Trinickia sp. NRRL B-1857]|uniref:PelD GGDEF domain-containing protein n=1 Tax=Trinickia sp. NRRL B-1857 TaxID=3162879 RepID=UPI003D2CEBE6